MILYSFMTQLEQLKMQQVDSWSYKRGVERIQLTVKVYLERATFTWYWGNHLSE